MKEQMKKIFVDLHNLYAEKDLWKIGGYLVGIAVLLEFLPDVYQILPVNRWKSLFAVFALFGCLILSVKMINQLLYREKRIKSGKLEWVQFLKRFIMLNLILLVFVLLQMGIFYPSFFAEKGNKWMIEKRILLWGIQGVSFSFYTQGIVAACRDIEKNVKEWMKNFLRFRYQIILWMTVLTFLVLAISYGLYRISDMVGQIGSVFLTVFLWLTAIVV